MKKPIVDIEDINEELKKLNEELKLLQDRFIAVALDYTHYIDNSWGEKEIYILRDSINYRFFSSKLHAELLIRQHLIIESEFKQLLKTDPNKIIGSYFPSNPYFLRAEDEISSIFDSFLYHQVSVFDYVGTLTNYICGPKSNKQASLKWTNLARSCRDSQNHFGKKQLSSKIKELHNQFVDKLYSYRSILIHEKAEKSKYSFTISIGSEEQFEANFIATPRLTKQFSYLRKLAKENRITIRYVTFWLIRKSIETVTEILFALKEEMETNPIVNSGVFGYHDPESNKLLPASTPWWQIDK